MPNTLKYMIFGIIGIAIFGLIYISATSEKQLPHGTLLEPENRQITILGKNLYAEHCAACHGRNLEGQVRDWKSPGDDGKLPAPPHDESGHTWHHNDQLLFKITKFGTAKAANLDGYKSDMPAFDSKLSDAEMIAILSFIKSTWPKHIQKAHNQLNAATHK